MGAWVSTGVEELDRELDGGIAPASVVLLQTPPESQGELLLKELALAQETLYLSTTRPPDAVREWIAGDLDSTGVTIEHFGSVFQAASPPEVETTNPGPSAGQVGASSAPVEGIALTSLVEAVTAFQDRGCILVDPLNPLEAYTEAAYMGFLDAVRDHLAATESVGMLHAVKAAAEPRCRWLSLQYADSVWDVRVGRDGTDVEFRLAVTKSRSGQVPDKEIKLELTDRVAIDVSRDIA